MDIEETAVEKEFRERQAKDSIVNAYMRGYGAKIGEDRKITLMRIIIVLSKLNETLHNNMTRHTEMQLNPPQIAFRDPKDAPRHKPKWSYEGLLVFFSMAFGAFVILILNAQGVI